jgi:undecaprenyl-diphosphatase
MAARRSGVVEILRSVGRPWIVDLLGMFVLMSAVGLVLTHVLDHTFIVHLDEHLARSLADGRTPRLDRLTGMGTFVADPLPVATLWALVVIVAAVTTRHWVAPLFPLLAIGGEKISYFFTTLVVERPRPDVPTIGTLHVTSSFPSGHVGSSITLYGSIVILLLSHARLRPHRRRLLAVAGGVVVATIAVVVGLSRMYRGHHFLTDVIAGAVVGCTWLVLTHRILGDRLPRHAEPELAADDRSVTGLARPMSDLGRT